MEELNINGQEAISPNAKNIHWDSDLENIGLPSNMYFGRGSQFGYIIYRLQKPNDDIRWCVFSVDKNYYIIKQQKVDNQWYEVWTKQMDKDLAEAKKYFFQAYVSG